MASAEFCSNPDLSMYKGTIYSSREMLPQQPKYFVQSPLVTVENHSNFTINKTPAEVQLTPKIKLYILLVTCMGFFSMGINSTIVRTTLVHMGLVFNVNTQQMAYTLTAINLGNVIGSILSIFNGSEAEIKPCSTDMLGLESVRHPFIIAGSFNISTSVLFFALVLVLKPRFLMKGSRKIAEALPIEDEKQSKNGSKTKKRIKHTKFVLLFLSVVYHVYTAFYLWYEYIFGCFLSTFAIKGLKLPVEQATLLVSLFYGSWAAGRIVASFLSIILSPTKMISINMTFTLIAYTLLLFSGYNDWTVWIGAGTLGFFLASTFSTLMLWVSDFMMLSSAISSVLLKRMH